MPFPTDLTSRQKLRDAHRQRALAEAAAQGRTLTCQGSPDHSTCHGATVCLCECHDPKEPAA